MVTTVMEEKYQQAANLINNTIHEDWEKVYLYSKVDDQFNRLFFYYYPVGKDIPIYYFDIQKYFEIDEDEFTQLRRNLSNTFKEL